MPNMGFGRVLIALGALMLIAGVVVTIAERFGLGRLPGDLTWRRGNTSFSFPIVTCIIVSVVATIVLNLLARLLR